MANGKKVIISVLLLAAIVELFFIVNTPDFSPKFLLGVPYNPFVIYFYLTLLAAVAVGVFAKK